MPRAIIVGCGFLGETAADFFSEAGWKVLGLCASEESAARLASKPYEVQVLDINQAGTVSSEWRGADALIHSVSSRGGDVDAYRRLYLEGLLNGIAAFHARRSLFVGSTSVYAQCDGSWVDEESETKPSRASAEVLLEAEGVALASGGYVLRLAGLYGPGRSVLRKKFFNGEAVLEEGGGRWINQIHRDDAARAIRHLFLQRGEPGIYNCADDRPATQREIYGWLADASGKPLPPEGNANPHPRRGRSSKRVSNAKLRATGWVPAFPSYAEALAAADAI